MTPYDAPLPTAPALAPAGLTDGLMDGLGRKVTYLRLSVTDRCDLRCVYCMAEHMRFLPKADVLTLEELERVASVFIDLGVRKLRLTGGEPLVRKGLLGLIERLSGYLKYRRAGRDDALHQRRAACRIRAGSRPARRSPRQRLDGHTRRRPVRQADPGRQPRQGPGRHRRRHLRPGSRSRSTPWRWPGTTPPRSRP